jgi:hypothetical protein
MERQRYFAYGPQWRFILCLFAAGFVLLFLAFLHVVSFGVGVALGIVPLGLALVATLRRLLFRRFIELGQDTFLVCTGVLQARARRIAYADIQETCEAVTGRMKVLTLKTKEGDVEISSTLMPDMSSYTLVAQCLVRAD